MTLTYRPGPWLVAVAGEALVAVLPTPQLSTDTLLARVWPAVEAGAELTGLLEALLADGWARAPHFVLVHQHAGQQLAVVVRGPARVVGEVSGSPLQLTGEGVLTWAEQRVDAVESLHLPGGGQLPDGPVLPLLTGAVMASAVLWGGAAGQSRSAPAQGHRDEDDTADAPPAPAQPVAPPPAAAPPQPPPPAAPPADPPAPGPWDHLFEPTDHQTLPPPADEPVTSPDADDPDHDQLTLTAAGAAALRQPPAADGVSQQETQVAAAPPARSWLLRLSDGQEVPVRGRVLVGREPRAERVPGSDVPHLVPVDSPTGDVSRTHLELLVDGRGALVARDLDSTNGTLVLAGGAPPRSLPPGASSPVPEGAVLDLGDGVTITAVLADR